LTSRRFRSMTVFHFIKPYFSTVETTLIKHAQSFQKPWLRDRRFIAFEDILTYYIKYTFFLFLVASRIFLGVRLLKVKVNIKSWFFRADHFDLTYASEEYQFRLNCDASNELYNKTKDIVERNTPRKLGSLLRKRSRGFQPMTLGSTTLIQKTYSYS